VSVLFMREKEVDLMRKIEAEDRLEESRGRRREKHALQKRRATKYVKDYVFAFAPLNLERVFQDGKEHVLMTMSKVSIEEKRKHKLIGYPDSALVMPDGAVVIRKGEDFEQRITPDMLMASETSPPPRPSPPILYVSTPSSIEIVWEMSLGFVISKYETQYRAVHRSSVFKTLYCGLKFSAVLSGLAHAQWFEFRVRAKGPKGWSEWSDISAPIRSAPLAPARPRTPAAGQTTWQSVEILWYAPDDNGETITSYDVQYRRYGVVSPAQRVNWSISRTVAPNRNIEIQSFTVDRLLPATEYEFRVRAVSGVGVGIWSRPFVVQTPGRSAANELHLLRETENWSEMMDVASGRTVYVNRRTQQRHLDAPDDFLLQLEAMDAETRAAAECNRVSQMQRVFKTKRYRFVLGLHKAAKRRRGEAPWEIRVRRGNIFEDALEAFESASVKKDLGRRMRVIYSGEVGIDEGGLTKDFFDELSTAMLDPKRGLFKRVDEPSSGAVYGFDDGAADGAAESSSVVPISPKYSARIVRGSSFAKLEDANDRSPVAANVRAAHLRRWRFCGMLVAKALFERKHMNLPLSELIWSHLVGRTINFDVLESTNRSLARSLRWMKSNKIEGVIYETFSVARSGDQTTQVPLITNGEQVDVTDSNKLDYIDRLVAWHTERKFGSALRAFKEGFHSLIPRASIEVFSYLEMEKMVNGEATVDVDAFRSEAIYCGGLNNSSPLVEWFWEVFASMTDVERSLFLRFVTGSPRIPLDGFDPRFQVGLDDGASPRSLPVSHTCFNQIILPLYASRGALRERLTYALRNTGKGFHAK